MKITCLQHPLVMFLLGSRTTMSLMRLPICLALLAAWTSQGKTNFHIPFFEYFVVILYIPTVVLSS